MKLFKVGQRVKVFTRPDSTIYKGTIINMNDFREPTMKYCVDMDDTDLFRDYQFVGEDNLEIDRNEEQWLRNIPTKTYTIHIQPLN